MRSREIEVLAWFTHLLSLGINSPMCGMASFYAGSSATTQHYMEGKVLQLECSLRLEVFVRM